MARISKDEERFRKGDDGKDLRVNGKYPYFRRLIRNKRLGA